MNLEGKSVEICADCRVSLSWQARWMKWFLVLSVSLVMLGVAAADRPNVLVIYTDDQGSVDAGCYGSDIQTPAIDALAETGVRFTQMLAPSAICSASRAGLLTGRYSAAAGVPANVSSAEGKSGMPHSQMTMADLFQAHGYVTGHIGKWHLGYTPETMPNGQGFDYSFGHMGGCIDNYSHFFYWSGPNRHDLWRDGKEIWRDGEYFGDMMIEETKAFISKHQEKPFFIYWAINWPHYPLQGTAKWREVYRDLPHPRDKYAAFMSTTDDLVGEVVSHIEALGLRDDTIIIFQSDHGHSVEERTFGGGGSAGPYRGHKGNLFEGGLRVPAVISWPGGDLPQGAVRDQMVCGIDWLPTLAEFASVQIPEDHRIHGKSIASVIRDEQAASPHQSLYWRLGHDLKSAKWVVREGDWKLHGGATESVRPEGVEKLTGKDRKLFLVNLADDIGETTNVADSHPDRVERMLKMRDDFEKDILDIAK